MKNRPEYKILLPFLGSMTVNQIKNATAEQMEALVGDDDNYPAKKFAKYLRSIKKLLLKDKQELMDKAELTVLKNQFKTWLENNFSNYKIEKGRELGKRFVTIWLDGKPEVGE